jgi:hypothetical protein
MIEHLPTGATATAARAPDRRRLILLALAVVATALPGRAQGEKKPFSPEELDQMLAPIALYPDALLSQILMAAGYPLEIVDAARWLRANPNAKGDAAVKAVADKGWDVSVKSLVAFPPVLTQLDEHLDWTQKLGDALIGQQADVAASIQRLRGKASGAGTLKSGKEQTVTAQTQGNETVYAIQPTDPETVYVPSYDPNSAYGQWPSSSYPPTYYPPAGGVLARGLMWGVGFAAAGAMFGGWNWGGSNGSYVNVNASRAVNIDRNFNNTNVGQGGRWQHQVDHRKGVAYRDNATRQQFGQNRPGAEQRQQFRGQVGADARPGGAGGAGGAGRPGGPGGPGGVSGTGGGQARPAQQPRGPSGGGGGGLSGVDRGQQVNREAQRGHQQQQRAAAPRGGGGGGTGDGGGRAGGGGGGGGGGGRGGGGGGGGGRR